MKTFFVLIKTNSPSDRVDDGIGQQNEPELNTFFIGSDNGLNLNIDTIDSQYMQTLKKICREAQFSQSYFTHLYYIHLN